MARRTDGNQKQIVDALRQVGATVQILSDVGNGCPDLAASWRGRTVFLEVKDPTQPLRGQKLTPAEAQWHARWQGEVFVIRTPDEALAAIGFNVFPQGE